MIPYIFKNEWKISLEKHLAPSDVINLGRPNLEKTSFKCFMTVVVLREFTLKLSIHLDVALTKTKKKLDRKLVLENQCRFLSKV
jgi:hypothetical protein